MTANCSNKSQRVERMLITLVCTGAVLTTVFFTAPLTLISLADSLGNVCRMFDIVMLKLEWGRRISSPHQESSRPQAWLPIQSLVLIYALW